jgi:hypothetical protein
VRLDIPVQGINDLKLEEVLENLKIFLFLNKFEKQ